MIDLSFDIKKNLPQDIARDLLRLGPKARAVSRRASRASAKPVIKMWQWVAPVETGATKKALGYVETGQDGSFYIGVRRDYVLRVSGAKAMKRYIKKGYAKPGTETLEKRPVKYAYRVERTSPKSKGWFLTTWNKTRRQMVEDYASIMRREIDKEFKKIAAKG